MSCIELTINNTDTNNDISGNIDINNNISANIDINNDTSESINDTVIDISVDSRFTSLMNMDDINIGHQEVPPNPVYINDFKKTSFSRVEESIDNLDYYMFYSYTTVFPLHNDHLNEDVKDVCSRVWKRGFIGGVRMLICVFIQTIITPMLIYYSISSNMNLCAQKSTIYQKITAAIFTFYINLNSINSLQDQLHIYLNINNFYILYHKYLSKTKRTHNKHKRRIFNVMINFFLSINIISCLLTTIGSVIIIYNSKTILDIILNSLALKFIDEIDNMSINKTEILVFKNNHERIKNDIEANKEFFDKYIPSRINQALKLAKKMCFVIGLGACLSLFLYLFTIVAQIWMFICY